MVNIVVLISGKGSNLSALINAGIHISLVVSNKSNASGLHIARQNNITTRVIPYSKKDQSRREYDADLASLIISYCQPDLIVLAGFMHILVLIIEHISQCS